MRASSCPGRTEAELYALSAAREGPVAVLATASAPEGDGVLERWGEMALTHYRSLGVPARLLELKTRQDASRVDLIAGIEEASMIFFSGGNPVYLARTLEGTRFLDSITRSLADGAVFAGCSAGAMVAGARAVRPVGPAFRSVGLGLIPHVRFGVHWNRMPGLLPGLKEFIVSGGDPADRFVGIDENTAIVGDGTRWRVFGLGGIEVRGPDGRARFRSGDDFSLA